MSNKTQLQLNNETLASILSNVLGLPSQESLKHGAYVWKKYTTTPIYVESSSKFYRKVVITEPQNAAITYEFSTTYTFDENTGLFTLGSGGGIRVPYDSSGKIDEPSKYYMIGTRTGTTMYKNDGTSGTPTLYNNAGGVTILAYNDSHLVTEYQSELIYEKSDFIDFVVSDQETAYPDGGTQDGYWYEKVVEGLQGEYYEVIPTSDTATIMISHTLGVTPSKILVISKTLPTLTYSTQGIFAPIFGNNSGKKGAILVNFYTTGNYPQAKISDLSTAVELSDKSVILHSYSSSYLFQSGITYEVYILA